MSKSPYAGFSLIEVLVVVSIMAVLVTIVVPSYQSQFLDVRRSLARVELLRLATRQEQYFLDHRRYAQRLTELGLPQDPYAINGEGNAVAPGDEDRVYLVSLVTRLNGYALVATPQLSQLGDERCGELRLDSTGLRRARNGEGAPDCW